MVEETQELPVAEEPKPLAEEEPKRNVDDLLAELEKAFFESTNETFTSYSVATSAGGSMFGQDNHFKNLITVDRFCQAIM